jgi:hypothetical protein
MRDRRERRVETGAAVGVPSTPEQRVSQLERLAKLHQDGILTDQELAEEKRRVLEASGAE